MKLKNKNLPHAIFLDIDGTIISEKTAFPEVVKKVISDVRSMGHYVFINTGRGMAFMPDFVKNHNFFDGIISALGSYIKVGSECIFNRPIDREKLDKVVEYCINHGDCCRFHGISHLLCHDLVKDMSPVWDMFYTKEQFYEKLGGDVIYKMTVDRGLSGEYKKFLSENFSVCSYTGTDYGEIASFGISKATGVEKVINFLGIPQSRTIAFGDSCNDYDMLRYVEYPICMGNGAENIKEICKFVTDSVENFGVATALEKLFFE